jgi:hypothetical protein
MKLFRFAAAFAASVVVSIGGAAALVAQTPPATSPPPPSSVPGVAQPPALPADSEQIIYARPIVRIGTPLTLGPGAAAREAVVIMSDATIAGRVIGDVVVVLGNLRLESTAVVEGSVVVVGGHATVVSGASIEDDFVTVGGAVDAPIGFTPRGEQVIVGPPGLGLAMREVAPWFTRGLLWGRVIVPDLTWIWTIVGIVLLVNLAIALAFPRAVRTCAETLSARPVGSFFAGLLTLLLFAPVVTILAISVVGLIIIPFLCCALVAGWMLGKVSVARWIGAGIMREDDPDSRGQGIRSMLIGFALICLTYMIPVLGLAAWAMVGVFGLGTATLTVMAGLKRERPLPPPQPVMPSAPPPAPAWGPPPVSADAMPGTVPLATSSGDVYVPPAAVPFQPAPPPANASASSPAASIGGPADLTAFPRSTFLERISAAGLDIVLVLIAYNLFDWWHDGRAFLVLLLAYHVVFWTLKGTTVGGIIFNLRLVRSDGSALTPSDAVVRGLTALLSAFALGLGFLWILRDPERQAWHDRVAGTYVVTVPRNWPLP